MRVSDLLRKYQEWVYHKDEESDFPITPGEVAFLLKEIGDTYKKEEIEKRYRKWVCGILPPGYEEDEFPITCGDVHYLLSQYYGEDPLSPNLKGVPFGRESCPAPV